MYGSWALQIRISKYEIRNNVQNIKILMTKTSHSYLISFVLNIRKFVFRICFETGAPPEGWGVRRTSFVLRVSDFYTKSTAPVTTMFINARGTNTFQPRCMS